jgi:hypothetical protein
LAVGVACVWLSSAALCDDLDEKPVGLRIGLALDRVSAFSDTLGRSASVAYPLGSSVNPAAYDFLREPPFDFVNVGTLTTNFVTFETGASVTGLSTSYARRLPGAGTLFGTYIRTDSHDAVSRQGDEFALRSNEVTFGYSRRLQQGLAVGGAVKLTDSFLGIQDKFMGLERQTDSDSVGADFKLGILAALSEHWLAGFCGGAGWSDSDAAATVAFPPPPIGPGRVRINDQFATTSVNLRGGVGWRPSDQFGLYSDLQYLHLGNKLGSVDVGRVFVGAEAFASPTVALRVGGSYDTEREATFSAGLSYFGIKGVPIVAAYSYNPFPEVHHEFGLSHLVSLSVVFPF